MWYESLVDSERDVDRATTTTKSHIAQSDRVEDLTHFGMQVNSLQYYYTNRSANTVAPYRTIDVWYP